MPVKNSENKEWKPNLFIPGFSKSGTNALSDYLKKHPEIYIYTRKDGGSPRTLCPKENLIFHNSKKEILKNCMPFSQYKKGFMKGKSKKYRLDRCDYYSNNDKSPFIIKNFSKKAKIIFIIREQKERLISAYYFTLTNHGKRFSNWLKRVEPHISDFLYLDKIKNYYEVFGEDMVVVKTEDLKNNSQEILNNLFKFLDIKKIEVKRLESNKTKLKNVDKKYLYFIAKMHYLSQKLFYMGGKALKFFGIYNTKFASSFKKISLLNVLNQFNFYKGKNNYSDYIGKIPDNIGKIMENDYKKTIKFCREKNILISRDLPKNN